MVGFEQRINDAELTSKKIKGCTRVDDELPQTKRELGELRSVNVEDSETRVKAAEWLPGVHVLEIS